MEKRRVLITGLGTVNPLGHNAADTWQAVRDGVCGIGPITRYDCSAQKVHLAAEVKDWDPTTVLDKKDVRHMSRYQGGPGRQRSGPGEGGSHPLRRHRLQRRGRHRDGRERGAALLAEGL